MLRAILELALRRDGIVITLAGALAICGVWTTSRAELDVFPEFVPPQVVVQTESPGLSPEQVERLVTAPIEAVVSGVARPRHAALRVGAGPVGGDGELS